MNTAAPVQQSSFVTVLSYLLIAFGALGIMGALMQNVMMNIVMPAIVQSTNQQNEFPAGIFTAFRIFAALMLAFSVFTTYAAYALLKRRDWARRTYIVVFALGIAWSVLAVVGIFLGVFFGFDAANQSSDQNKMPVEAMVMFKAMFAMMSIVALAFGVLYGWLIKRLRSPAIKAEFV